MTRAGTGPSSILSAVAGRTGAEVKDMMEVRVMPAAPGRPEKGETRMWPRPVGRKTDAVRIDVVIARTRWCVKMRGYGLGDVLRRCR